MKNKYGDNVYNRLVIYENKFPWTLIAQPRLPDFFPKKENQIFLTSCMQNIYVTDQMSGKSFWFLQKSNFKNLSPKWEQWNFENLGPSTFKDSDWDFDFKLQNIAVYNEFVYFMYLQRIDIYTCVKDSVFVQTLSLKEEDIFANFTFQNNHFFVFTQKGNVYMWKNKFCQITNEINTMK